MIHKGQKGYTKDTVRVFIAEMDAYLYPPEAINMTYDGVHPSDKGYDATAKCPLSS